MRKVVNEINVQTGIRWLLIQLNPNCTILAYPLGPTDLPTWIESNVRSTEKSLLLVDKEPLGDSLGFAVAQP